MTKHILLIDDERDIREVAEVALSVVGGWQVSTAASGREGIAKAIANPPDAILLDVMMPDMDGFATLQALRSQAATRSIPVILLTAKVQSADQHRFELWAVAAVLVKPFKAMQLAEQIAAILQWPTAS
ncbi:MAG: response regulator [Leptolyngbyaceae cyanobacterium SM1_1_3]|nr:response regulator [Leptolyngbyaceae cyanobacterium SM1_1_3]NJN02074.1 response regulator [Leptolyngbyaceae cyanobacterium RM1_1_2]NJO11974.1 response regulator [Leptolyngbyaceae cyanobacterium SL_1_1]